MEPPASFIVGTVVVVFALIIIGSAIRIVPEYQRLVVLRLGRALGARGPGLILLIPIVDRGIKVDLREIFRAAETEIPKLTEFLRLQLSKDE